MPLDIDAGTLVTRARGERVVVDGNSSVTRNINSLSPGAEGEKKENCFARESARDAMGSSR